MIYNFVSYFQFRAEFPVPRRISSSATNFRRVERRSGTDRSVHRRLRKHTDASKMLSSQTMTTLSHQSLSSTEPEQIVSIVQDVFSRVFSEEAYDWQIQAIGAILAGRDVIVSAGTGSGKSRVFQVPALAVDGGIVLVVAPVKSLMHDQVHLRLPVGLRC